MFQCCLKPARPQPPRDRALLPKAEPETSTHCRGWDYAKRMTRTRSTQRNQIPVDMYPPFLVLSKYEEWRDATICRHVRRSGRGAAAADNAVAAVGPS